MAESTANASFSGNCDVDVDECVSSPCENGATCSQSQVDVSISAHAYQCICTPGYANGHCTYLYIGQYTDECTVFESLEDPSHGGNCVIDVDECASSPCTNGATCRESTSNSTFPVHAYACSCVDGFANGICPFEYIDEYEAECNVG